MRFTSDLSPLFRPVAIGPLRAGNALCIQPMEGCDGTLDGKPDELTVRTARLFFWRTRSGVEIDFVIYGSGEFWAIEVQNSKTVRSNDLRPLRSFKADYPEAQPLLLYRGDEALLIDGIRCLPVDDFLRSLIPAQPLIADLASPENARMPFFE